MKMIVAYIQPERLPAVKRALAEAGVWRMSVTTAVGAGSQGGYQEKYRGAELEVNLLKKTRLELAVNDEFVEPTIAAITAGARSGKIGDGKIFVMPLERCIRIRTGEDGTDAIG
jgi:nitrogen regulatory protein P-II 1